MNRLEDEIIDENKIELDSKELIDDIEIINKTPVKVNSPLWPHQAKALDFIKDKLDEILINMFCGTGKTRIIYEIIKNNPGTGKYIIVPTIDLLYQIYMQYFKDFPNKQMAILLVCSSKEKNSYIDATTSADKIEEFKKNNKDFLIISTYTSRKLLKPAESDIVIYDEAHHLYSKEVECKNIYYFSATPREWQQELKNIYTYTCYEAIKDKIIQDYEIYVGSYNLEKEDIIIKQCAIYKCLSECFDEKNNIHNNDINKILCFNRYATKKDDKFSSSNLIKNKDITATINTYLKDFKTGYIDGTMTRDMRRKILNEFEESKKFILNNSKLLSEGIDINNIDCISFIDSKKSPIEIVQALGRCVRKKNHDKPSLIFIPIKMEKETDLDQAIKNNKFSDLINLLRGLRDHDIRIFNLLSGNKENAKRINYYNFEDNDEKKIEELQNKIIAFSIKKNWDAMCATFLQFIKDNKRLPNKRKNESEKSLGIWMDNQRIKKKYKLLSNERINLMESTEYFTFDHNTKSWQNNYSKFKQYLEENKKEPSCHDKDEIIKNLGRWVADQRKAYHKNNLDKDKQDRLLEIPGFTFNIKADIWNQHFNNFKKFMEDQDEKEPKLPSSVSKNQDEKKLGIWLNNQRNNWIKLEQNRKTLLNSVRGFVLNAKDELWETNYNLFANFVINNNRLPKQGGKLENEDFIADWGSRQRLNKDGLSEERKNKLLAVNGFKFNQLDGEWDQKYEELKEFIDDNKDTLEEKKISLRKLLKEKNKLLYTWLEHQHIIYKSDTETNIKRRIKLEELKFFTKPKIDKNKIRKVFNEIYDKLSDFIKENNKLPSTKDKVVYKYYKNLMKNYNIYEDGQKQLLDDIQNKYGKVKKELVHKEEKLVITKNRPNQSIIREILLKNNPVCALSNIKAKSILQVCHIKPHSQCSDEEKLDLNNVLLMVADLHILFDNNTFIIQPTGEITFNNKAIHEDIEYAESRIINKKINVNPEMAEYLKIRNDNLEI